LVQADGKEDLENKYNNGDIRDAYPSLMDDNVTFKHTFGVHTTPNSMLSDGTVRDISITNISNSGNTMTFNAVVSAISAPQGKCHTLNIVTPANITATNMIISKSENPCRSGICTITVDVTWQNTGGAGDTFTPRIIVDNGSPIDSLPSIKLSQFGNDGDTVTRTFTLTNMNAATHNICPNPN
jgi:hypothetical protein